MSEILKELQRRVRNLAKEHVNEDIAHMREKDLLLVAKAMGEANIEEYRVRS